MKKFVLAGLLLCPGLLITGNAYAQSCPGNLIAVKPIRQGWPDGPKIGELQVYYNPATGKNCARTMHSARTWGKKLYTEVYLQTCRKRNFDPVYGCPASAPIASDNAPYLYRAGPVSLYGRDRCIDVFGGMKANPTGTVYQVNVKGHCR